MLLFSFIVSEIYTVLTIFFSMQTAVEVFKRIILEMEKADGNAAPEEKKCAVM